MDAKTWDNIVIMRNVRQSRYDIVEKELKEALKNKDYRAVSQLSAELSQYALMIAELNTLECCIAGE